jgi:hypothetical protein
MDEAQGGVMGLLEGGQVIIQTSGGSQVHYQVHTSSLDGALLGTVEHTGDLDTVQLVHSYNLPPSAEREETVVEQLLLEASGIQVTLSPIDSMQIFKSEIMGLHGLYLSIPLYYSVLLDHV